MKDVERGKIGTNLKIGQLSLTAPVCLAPMAGLTDSAFRSVCLEHGAALAMTEVVNAEALVRGSARTLDLMAAAPGEQPVSAHFYGASAGSLADAARRAEDLGRFAAVDINGGCPVRKIVSKGAGAALMASPSQLETIVRAVVDAVSLPVTVKTRTGLSSTSINISETARAAEQGGAAAVFIHCRPASCKHHGPPDWETLARVASERRIPVIGNGGVSTAEDVLRMLGLPGVDGVMIGRAALGYPWIFDEARRLLEGRAAGRPCLAERRAVVLTHFMRLCGRVGQEYRGGRRRRRPAEEAAVMRFRPHLLKYTAGFSTSGMVRRRLNSLRTPAELRDVVDAAFDGQASAEAKGAPGGGVARGAAG